MRKFLAVVRREYVQRVRSKTFVVATVLGPLSMLLFTLVPALLLSVRTGEPTRVAVVDQTGKLYARAERALREAPRGAGADDDGAEGEDEGAAASFGAGPRPGLEAQGERARGDFTVEQIPAEGRPLEEVRRELNERVLAGKLDAYLVVPPDVLAGGQAQLYGRNTSDVFTLTRIRRALDLAAREQRLAEAGIDERLVRGASRPVRLSATKVTEGGEERDSGQSFALAFGVGFVIYLTILLYGQVVLAAVVEEKETRIAEVLFSSTRAWTLMLGKLIGVSLVALTQFAIWGAALLALALYGAAAVAAQGVALTLPGVSPSLVACVVLFFLVGYFVYAALYALVGAAVTTAQEGGQLSLPITFLLVIVFYLAFPVMRAPDSPFAFWVSMVPFFSPVVMLVRIAARTPPAWQIALSLLIGFATALALVWLAARVYRIGMLMYGKRATIPEVLRWVRRA